MTPHLLTSAGLGLACVVTGWIAVIAPARTALAARQQRAAAVQTAAARARMTVAMRPQVERELRAFGTALNESATVMPNEFDQDALFRGVGELAAVFHLRVTRFAPKPPVTTPDYSEWPIDLAFEGTYPDVQRFFGRLATMRQLVSVTDFDVKALADPAPARSIAVRCTATAFGAPKKVPTGAQSVPIDIRVGSAADAPPVSLGISSDDAGGERDPFVRATPVAKPAGPAPRRATTLADVGAVDVSVRAIVRAGALCLSVLTAPDGRSFVAREGDHLRDAIVASIDATGVTFAVAPAPSADHGERREIRQPLRRAGAQEPR